MFTWLYNWLYGYKTIPTVEPAPEPTPEEQAEKIRSVQLIPVYVISSHHEVKIKVYPMAHHSRIGYLMAQIKKKNNVRDLGQRQWVLKQGSRWLTPNIMITSLDDSKTGYLFLTLHTV